MPAYYPADLERKWQKHWKDHKTFQAHNDSAKPKYYVLDMFPYPSGAGLHVGHPLGYIASDIVARYKRLQGFNVLHPMGFDSFGLPAEQYAIQTGQHPALTTDQNIATYIKQLNSLGFSYDWDREVRTSDPQYYKWTQWIFLKLFNAWYNLDTDRAEPLTTLLAKFAATGSQGIRAAGEPDERPDFTPGQWSLMSEKQKLAAVLPYRLAYQQDTSVNWCPALGTVLSNDEVKDGLSERGGYPVERRLMPQWNLRITAYADRLLAGLDTLDWPDAVKEMQRNWIGKSIGAEVTFPVLPAGTDVADTKAGAANFIARNGDSIAGNDSSVAGNGDFIDGNSNSVNETGNVFNGNGDSLNGNDDSINGTGATANESGDSLNKTSISGSQMAEIKVYTTRVDTIYGATFLVLAPEHELVGALTTPAQRAAVSEYIAATKRRSERDRLADVKAVSGVFTGAYAENPVSGAPVPIWLADYVLAGYGTGAVMAVPSGDQRDWLFATHFGLPIVAISDTQQGLDQQADPTKEGHYINSGLINGLGYQEATTKLIAVLEEKGLGRGKVNFRLRDAIFGRQRYWGEPIPIYYKDGTAYGLPESELPLVLPEINEYKPTETGEPPLGRAQNWKYQGQYDYELSTMPGWAGSSWYYLRYMDPENQARFVGADAEQYWGQVDLYMGGAEHATGHLLYARFWYLFLKDLGLVSGQEPFQKLINQGMILGVSEKIRRSGRYSPSQGKHVATGSNMVFIVTNGKAHRWYEEDYITVYTSSTVKRDLTNEDAGIASAMEISVPIEFTSNSLMTVENMLRYLQDASDNSHAAFAVGNGYYRFVFRDGKHEYVGFVANIQGEEPENFQTRPEIEKMSKSKRNVVNPDVLIDKFGADALRLYEMFLGPLEQFKPWNTNGITGVSGFLKKFWRLFHPEDGPLALTDAPATPAELKTLHRAIRKVAEDIDKFSFNTSVSVFMITVNELTALGCRKRAVLEPLVVLLSPFAPHLSEELWAELGHAPGSISHAAYPEFREEFLAEAVVTYPVAVNGKVREQREFAATATAAEIEAAVRASDFLARFGEGKEAKKVIVVPGRMVNVVV